MAGTRLTAKAVLLLQLCWSTYQVDAQALTVEITVDRTDPPGFTPENPTDYRAASGPQITTCRATGGTGAGPTYQWSSNCRDCPFLVSTSVQIHLGVVHSGDTGIHTCTVTRGGESVQASTTFNIVGYGIHVFTGTSTSSATIAAGSLPNNGLVIATATGDGADRFLHFSCRSDSMMGNIGEIIGLDDTVISGGRFVLERPQPGEITVENSATQGPLQNQEQGVYTCRIPDSTNTIQNVNVGIYITGFNTIPSIANPLVFTQGSSSSTLTCTSTGSVATTVTFMRDSTTVGPLRDGESMESGGVTYQLTQTVTNRPQSTYQNVLTINQPFADIGGSTFTCSVENTVGTSPQSESLQIMVAIAIDVPPMNTNITTIEDVFLTCTASGYPIPSISWTHNDTDIDEDDNRFNITESNGFQFVVSTLTVSGAMVNNSGEYVCNATNTFSTAIGGPAIVLVQDTPEQPQNVHGTALNSTAIELNWFESHDNNAPILGYRVRYSRPEFLDGSDVELGVTSEMAVVTGLSPGVTYNFTVIAFNEIGDSRESAVAMVATEGEEPSSPPQNVVAVAMSSTEIMVTWEAVPMIDRNGIIINYEIQIEPLDFPADIFIDPLNTTNLSILVADLEEHVLYNISVRAYTNVGPGPYSDPVTKSTFEDAPATPPQNVQATAISSTEIMVTWDEIPGLDQNGIITEYEVQTEPLDFPADISVDLLTASSLSIVVTGLQEYVFYDIRVRAYTIVGPGPYSDPVTVRTFEDVPVTPPENVQAFVISSTEILVSWIEVPALDQNGVIINYEVQLEPLDFSVDISVDLVNTTSLQERATDLEEFINYNIAVRAYTSVGPGPYSDPVTVRTLEDRPATPPQNVEANAISSTEIMVTWEEVLPIDQNGIITVYEVQYEPLQFMESLNTLVTNTTDMAVNLTNIQENIEYNIIVRAYTSVGPGPYSDPVTERTFVNLPEGDRTSSAFLRFSVVNLTIIAEIVQNETSVINTEIALLRITQSILDVAAFLSVTRRVFTSCKFVTNRPTDVVNYWLRVECSITETPASDTTLEFVRMIEETLPMYFIGVSGILIIPSLTAPEIGFCDYEVSITSRGNYTWPETTGGNEVELECQLGPAVGVASDTAIGRRRCNTSGEWEDPQLENCITMVALQLQQLEELLNNTELTEENVGEVNQGLREIIDEAGEEDQTEENLQVVASVFTTTAALLSEPTVPVEVDTVNDIVEVLDTIQVWPEEVVGDMGPDIVKAFEEIVTSLVEQDNFTNLTFVGDDLIFTAESVEVEILVNAGRGFSSSRDENGTLRTTSENAGEEEELLAPEEIATAFLSPSLFEQFESDAGEVGIFFSLYESSSLFPIARESDSPTTVESEDDGGIMSQVGSPVVAATVSAGGQTEFRNLSDPVIVVLRLNTVLDGNITRRTCVSYDFNLADGIGNWTSEGCKTSVSEDDPNIVTCSCNHLTNFACLVDICTRTEGCELTSAARVALEVLSIIGVVLSLVGIILTIITLLIFKTLRKRVVTKFHIQLCIAILCMLLVFVIGIDRVPPKHPYGGCVAMSALIHYFTLAAVMWMGAEALLMFQKLVIVFIQITTKYIVIVSIVCWAVPIIPVVIPLGIEQDFMVNHDSANDITFCFIGDRRVFFGAFLGPILAVLLFNLVIMVVVITVLVRHTRDTMGRQKEQMKLKTTFRLLLNITGIMSLFGLTWIFGALTISGASLPFQILFVVSNGFQGFFIFLFLCVSRKDARELWKESLSCGRYKSSKIHRKNQGTDKFSTGGTKKPKTAAGIVAGSVQKSKKPIVSVVSDAEVLKNPYISADQMPVLGGGSLTFGHSNKRNEGGDIICIENPQAIDLLEIQPEEAQRPGSSALVSSEQVGAESSSEEIRGSNAKMNGYPMVQDLSQCDQV